jgi:sulfur carrier protein
MLITVNGDARSFPDPACVADVLPDDARGLAVAVNGVVVCRADHAATLLAEGDAVEIVTAVQGG